MSFFFMTKKKKKGNVTGYNTLTILKYLIILAIRFCNIPFQVSNVSAIGPYTVPATFLVLG